MNWETERVLILGGARQGTALARFVSLRGGQVLINDRAPSEALASAQASLMDLEGIDWVFGGHPLTMLDDVSIVCVSGGIPLDIPLLIEAISRGIPVTNDSQIFLEETPCPVIGITGSAGKTTTTAMIGHIADVAFGTDARVSQSNNGTKLARRAWVGGNIGNPLISQVDNMGPDDLAIMELSSFQLELMTLAPQIAVLLNLTPNHLDRHKTMAAYTAAKSRILTNQKSTDIAILGHEDPGAWDLSNLVRGDLYTFGSKPLNDANPGAFLCGEEVCVQNFSGERFPVLPLENIPLKGEHNRLNVIAAVVVAFAASLSFDAIREGVSSFAALPHRLEFVRQWGGADWYNDLIATAPERALAAIRSFSEPLILLIGGRDKDLPWLEFLEVVKERVDHLVIFGEAADKILEGLYMVDQDLKRPSVERVPGLHEAVHAAAHLAEAGDVVLFSPGGTSFDEFRDFEERGEYFKRWVMELS